MLPLLDIAEPQTHLLASADKIHLMLNFALTFEQPGTKVDQSKKFLVF